MEIKGAMPHLLGSCLLEKEESGRLMLEWPRVDIEVAIQQPSPTQVPEFGAESIRTSPPTALSGA
jgi:hypothetical protein